MKTLRIFCLAFVLVGCASQNDDKVNSDEVHRHVDWTATVSGLVVLDTINDEWNKATFVETSSTASLQDLSDLLFDAGFSGDSKVFAPDIFGILDVESSLDPEALLEELKVVDTTSIEDLRTGKLRDTIIDLSFTREAVSMVRIFCSFSDNSLSPKYASLGSIVYDEITGALRGYSSKFYMQVGEDLNLGNTSESLVLATDSLGVFRPVSFMMHGEDSDMGVSEYARAQLGQDIDHVNCSFELNYESSTGQVYLKNLEITPVEKPL